MEKDGVEQTINGDTVLQTQTQKGEVWTLRHIPLMEVCKVLHRLCIHNHSQYTAIDYFVETTTDTPNAASSLSIEAIQAEDADGDSVSLEIHWYQDGDPHPEFRNDQIIPAEQTTKDQVWEASILPHDGEEEGSEYIQTFTIQNTAPEIVSVQITPQNAFESSILTAQIEAIDEDMDVLSYSLSWSVNGNDVANTETLDGTLTKEMQLSSRPRHSMGVV